MVYGTLLNGIALTMSSVIFLQSAHKITISFLTIQYTLHKEILENINFYYLYNFGTLLLLHQFLPISMVLFNLRCIRYISGYLQSDLSGYIDKYL